MATFAPKVAVQSPTRQALPFGLFSVFQPQSSAERWLAGGAQWEALNCNAAVGLSVSAQSQTSSTTHDFENSRSIFGEAEPFTVAGYHKSSLLNSNEDDARSKAEQQLLLHEQRRVEQALWLGDLENYPSIFGSNNPDQYAAPEDLGTAEPVEALAALEHFIASELGFLGVIHVPRRIASIFASEGLIETRGGRMFTGLETPVVAGAGYSGNSIAVTPPIFGYRNNVEVWDVADTDRNNRLTVASRDYVIGFDPCGTAEVQVALETSNDNGGGSSGPSEVTIIGTTGTLPVSVEGSVDSNITNDSLPVSGSVSVSGTSDVNVTNDVLNVEIVPEETPEPEA